MSAQLPRITGEGLTYDDVLLIPAFSDIMPREVDLTTRFSRNITQKKPIVSAAMDTITNATMAIAIAREGGIGVLRKNMTIAEQVSEVRKVKRAEAGMGYTGSRNIEALRFARFLRITQAGITESHPHDITITREAPNYSR
ncbi:MAG: hypothetical protein CVU06_01125 [Bacteroidetes bacterium HGW-Bacteroidetes-22]|nr:MAG: hypothetical protein CVU06_01125 [Bacteroidetes bacterium HGW-Bacteroidetes-22]